MIKIRFPRIFLLLTDIFGKNATSFQRSTYPATETFLQPVSCGFWALPPRQTPASSGSLPPGSTIWTVNCLIQSNQKPPSQLHIIEIEATWWYIFQHVSIFQIAQRVYKLVWPPSSSQPQAVSGWHPADTCQEYRKRYSNARPAQKACRMHFFLFMVGYGEKLWKVGVFIDPKTGFIIPKLLG